MRPQSRWQYALKEFFSETMASAYVPPAPSYEGDFDFGSSQSQRQTFSQLSLSRPLFLNETKNEEPILPGYIQRVPETPLLQQQQSFPSPRPWGVPSSSSCSLNFSFDTDNGRDHIGLRPVCEIPEKFRSIFREFTHFNYVQSKVLDDVMYTDAPLVTSAPTGSGKTVIFELAIIRLLMQSVDTLPNGKIVYVAPIKALCSERYEDWKEKFGSLNLHCCELTGDSQLDDYFELQRAHIVMTTPEKWDSMTRKWRDYKSLVQQVQLFLIDEVHQLNDETRGPTMEAIVSRMKTIQAAMKREDKPQLLRFIAISATIPNIADVAAWLGSSQEVPARHYSIDESHRPVRLRRVVLGYPDASTEFKFDLALNYRLGSVIQIYSDQKPTLVFCATRKGTQQAAGILVKEARFVMNATHKQRLMQTANTVRDAKLRELVSYGVGYHHAGMDIADRKTIETMFTVGDLPVLFATSTLAMGVNLPAHLVVIKSTMHYMTGMYRECSESQILQMIGRAGRPQFDTTATAVIMTRNSTKSKYEALVSGRQLIESNLHKNLIEHLNAEIVLHTITDVTIALEWLHSTFFYIRVKQNPNHYGMPIEQDAMEEKLQKLCLKNLQMLESCTLVKMDDGLILQHTDKGRLMARYCVAFESMKRFLGFKGQECLAEMVNQISLCKEFVDVRLRVNEKKVLNTLNKDKNKPTIRFQLSGKIKSTDMKVNCLIQATLGCLPVQEFALNQDVQKIMRAASRLSKCLMELEIIGDSFRSLLNAVIMHKCIQARLWENSKHVAKQLDKIGLHLSTTLVNGGLTDFQKILNTGPREIELIMNRHPPFGNQIKEAVALIPHYELGINQVSGVIQMKSELEVTVFLVNHAALKEKGATWPPTHTCLLLIGDASNKVLCKQKISDSQLLNCGRYTRKLIVQRSTGGDSLKVNYISLDHVGVDVHETFTPKYAYPLAKSIGHQSESASEVSSSFDSTATRTETPSKYRQQVKPCCHKCFNKAVCGHDCCKNGIQVKSKTKGTVSKKCGANTTPKPPKPTGVQVNNYANQLHTRASHFPSTPALNRIKPNLAFKENNQVPDQFGKSLSDKFSYTPKASFKSKCQSTRAISDIYTVSYSEHSSSYAGKENNPYESSCSYDVSCESDVDKYMEDIEEMDLYATSPVYEGEDAGDYDAFSPLDSVDHSCAVIPDRCATQPPCYDQTLSVMHKTSSGCYDNNSKQYKQQKWPIAGRKRLIDEILDFDDSQQHEDEPCDLSSLQDAKKSKTIACWGKASAPPNTAHYSKETDLVTTPAKRKDDHRSYGRLNSENNTEDGCITAILSPRVVKPQLVVSSTPSFCFGTGNATSTHHDMNKLANSSKQSNQPIHVAQRSLDAPTPCSFFTAPQHNAGTDDDDGDIFGSVFSGIF